MGRKKIQISKITDERNRQVTFNKRKFGVMKKAYELSVLCDCEIALIIFSSSNKLYQYASTDMDKVLLKYTEYNEPHESLTNKNIIEKENKNGVMSPESPEPEGDYTLTPRTEAKFNKIDEDFQLMVRSQQMGGRGVNMSSGNYTLPVTVPVAGAYGDSSMLQASPQMAHTNISPRPSSSETDSVYPAGSMLEMSNGYPNSSSPLGGSPSPGPSPGIGGHHHHHTNNNNHIHKPHHISHKQHSPGGGQGRVSSNLRVVIPTPMTPNMTTADDLTYAEHNNRQSQSTLNTPVVALQTPLPCVTGYPLGTFTPQDFSLNSSDVGMSLNAWAGHPNLTTVQHTRFGEIGLPHLAVSNSTPPPSTSPLSVKVKSEPVSPPRDHHQHNSIIAGGGGGGNSSSNNNNSHNHTTTITTMCNAVTNQTLLSHPQQHLIMNSRPSSTGHLTPTSVYNYSGTVTPTNVPSPDMRHANSVSSQSSLPDYDSPNNNSHKRPRISEGWTT